MMGVPDEVDGPVRKRPRLSLRTSRKPDLLSDSMSQSAENVSTETVTDTPGETGQSSSLLAKTLETSSDCIDLTADLPASSDPLVAPVASLHNLGNTCFMNSMLEVLRYTPGFLSGLNLLEKEITLEESKQEDGEDSDSMRSDVKLAWQVVKNTYNMYREMNTKEEQFAEVATSDASSMAVRPSLLLDNIRELNPMFEGHFQHDAQELLRCLLCYVEDAEKELKQISEREKAKLVKQEKDIDDSSDKQELCNGERVKTEPVMDTKEITAGGSEVSLKGGDSQCSGKGKLPQKKRGRGRPPKNAAKMANNTAAVSTVINGSDKTASEVGGNSDVRRRRGRSGDKLNDGGKCGEDEVDGHLKENATNRLSSQNVDNNLDPSSEPTTTIAPPNTRKRKRSRSKSSSSQVDSVNDVDGKLTSKKRSSAGEITNYYSGSREKNKTAGLENGDEGYGDSNSVTNLSSSSNEDETKKSQREAGSGDGAGLLHKLQQKLSLKPGSKTGSKSASRPGTSTTDAKQPSILSMFPLNQIKRLGMRGRVIFDQVRQAGRGAESNQDVNNNGATSDNDSNNNNNNSEDDVNNNSDNNNNNSSNSNDDNNNNNNDNMYNYNSSGNNDGSNNSNAPDSCDVEVMEVDLLEIPESSTSPAKVVNGYISTSPNVSPRKSLHSGETTPKKLKTFSPAKSPIMVEFPDEISAVQEKEVVSSIESTIDSVTKKYYSSLSQAGKSTTVLPPLDPSSATMPSSSVPNKTSMDFELIVEGPSNKPAEQMGENSAPAPSPSQTTESDMDIVVHSPKKKIGDPDKVLVCVSPKKTSGGSKSVVSAGGLQHKPETMMASKSSSATSSSNLVKDCDSQMTQPLMISTDISTSSTSWLSPAPAHLQAEIARKSKSASAPNSPANLLRKSSHRLRKPSCNSPKGRAALMRSPGAGSLDLLQILQPKLELKKCDWLGVSPVKSISASRAMLVLDSKFHTRHTQSMADISSARRRILCDDSDTDNGSISKVTHVTETQQQKSHKLRSSNQGADSTQQAVDANSNSATSAINADISTSSSSTPSMPNPPAAKKQTTLDHFQTTSTHSPRPTRSQRSPHCGSNSTKAANTSQNSAKDKSGPLMKSGKNITLRPLSISLDNCDWLLAAKTGQTISAKQALRDLKKWSGAIVKPEGIKDHKVALGVKVKEEEGSSCNAGTPSTGSTLSGSTVVEQLFGGIMMHRTKCLECEIARERQEAFMDISVPVRNLHSTDDDSDDEENANKDAKEKSSESCLSKLMQAFSSVERLKDNNKYFCEQCGHYVEAERSCHYTTLPAVLTLHLKRFSAHSGHFGGVSKLNDKVTIPQNLPCLRYQCRSGCSEPSHRYSLFAIVTHSGLSILHGHYRAYVKVQPSVNPSVFYNLSKSKAYEDKMETEISDKTAEAPSAPFIGPQLMWPSTESSGKKTFVADEHGFVTDGSCSAKSHSEEKSSAGSGNALCDSGKSVNGIVLNGKAQSNGVSKDWLMDGLDLESGEIKPAKKLGKGNRREKKYEHTKAECYWLECDDECIKVMEESEFVDKLEEKEGALMGTPYVLFYHKLQS